MTFLDRFLQRWRIRKSIPYIPNDSVVLDIGCHHGQLFTKLGTKLRYGVGIDPILEMDIVHAHYELLKDSFPSNRAAGKLYHCITILAVLEHIPQSQQEAAITACYTLLQKEGFVILTIPDKRLANNFFALPIQRSIVADSFRQGIIMLRESPTIANKVDCQKYRISGQWFFEYKQVV